MLFISLPYQERTMLALDKEQVKPILINELGYIPVAADFFLRHYPAIHDELAPAVERWLEDRTVLDTEINGISIKQVMQIQACNFLMAELQLENWRNLDPATRLAALQRLETELAKQEDREACRVRYIPESSYTFDQDQQIARGNHNYTYHLIEINATLVEQDTPYQAVNTLFHEAWHEYQDDAALNHPGKARNAEEYNQWKTNRGAGYFQPEESAVFYHLQPVERNARQIAQERTHELYGNTNNPAYIKYNQDIQLEDSFAIALAIALLGPDYEKIIDQGVQTRNPDPLMNQFTYFWEHSAENEIQRNSLTEPEATQTTPSERAADYAARLRQPQRSHTNRNPRAAPSRNKDRERE